MNKTPDLLDIDGVAEFFGGNRPLHRATIWRKIREGKIPAPIRELRRWDRQACEAARQRFVDGYSDSVATDSSGQHVVA